MCPHNCPSPSSWFAESSYRQRHSLLHTFPPRCHLEEQKLDFASSYLLDVLSSQKLHKRYLSLLHIHNAALLMIDV